MNIFCLLGLHKFAKTRRTEFFWRCKRCDKRILKQWFKQTLPDPKKVRELKQYEHLNAVGSRWKKLIKSL